MLVFVNAEKEHSVNTGQLLGSRDSREAIEIVFDPLYQQAECVGSPATSAAVTSTKLTPKAQWGPTAHQNAENTIWKADEVR